MAGRNKRRAADWFSHDADASTDEKIKYLESKFGHTGYAVFFKMIEKMTRSPEFKLEWNDIKKSVYAAEFGISVTEMGEFITECCRKEIKAFKITSGKIYSPGLIKRMKPLVEKREYNRKIYEQRKDAPNKPLNNNNSVTEIQQKVTEKEQKVTEMTQRKGKERKEKNEPPKPPVTQKTKKLIPPTCEEVQKYFTDNGYTAEAGKKAWAYYDSGNWKDSYGKPVKSWKQKMRGVWFKPENEIKPKQSNFKKAF